MRHLGCRHRCFQTVSWVQGRYAPHNSVAGSCTCPRASTTWDAVIPIASIANSLPINHGPEPATDADGLGACVSEAALVS